jgi:hypothetical protein
VVGSEWRDSVKIEVPNFNILSSRYPPCGFLRPSNRCECSANAIYGHKDAKLIHKKTTISSWYKSGFSRRRSQRASSIGGVIVRRRPIPLAGALTLPKHREFERAVLIDRGVQWAAWAISALVYDCGSCIMSRMSSSRHDSSVGAIFTRRCLQPPVLTACSVVPRHGLYCHVQRLFLQ